MWDKVAEMLKGMWAWIAAALALATASLGVLFLKERRARKDVQALGKADLAGAVANSKEASAKLKTEGVLPVLEQADAGAEVAVADVRKDTAAKIEAGRNDDAKKLADDFRRAGY